MNPSRKLDAAYALALAVPAALLAAVYIAQYGFGLPPCEMCWWQRYAHFAALALAIGAWVMRRQAPGVGRLLVALAAVAIGVAGLIGAYHAGVEYHWWEGLTVCSSTRIEGDALSAILNAPLVRCDTAAWTLFGISLAGYDFLVSGAAAAVILWLLSGSRKGAFA